MSVTIGQFEVLPAAPEAPKASSTHSDTAATTASAPFALEVQRRALLAAARVQQQRQARVRAH